MGRGYLNEAQLAELGKIIEKTMSEHFEKQLARQGEYINHSDMSIPLPLSLSLSLSLSLTLSTEIFIIFQMLLFYG